MVVYQLNVFHPFFLGDVTVICNQTHKIQTVKASRLSLEEGELTEEHLTVGSQVLLEEKGSHFLVMIVIKAGKKGAQKRKHTESGEAGKKRTKREVKVKVTQK